MTVTLSTRQSLSQLGYILILDADQLLFVERAAAVPDTDVAVES